MALWRLATWSLLHIDAISKRNFSQSHAILPQVPHEASEAAVAAVFLPADATLPAYEVSCFQCKTSGFKTALVVFDCVITCVLG